VGQRQRAIQGWQLASLIARTEGIETYPIAVSPLLMASSRASSPAPRALKPHQPPQKLPRARLASLIARTEGIETLAAEGRDHRGHPAREPHRPHRGH